MSAPAPQKRNAPAAGVSRRHAIQQVNNPLFRTFHQGRRTLPFHAVRLFRESRMAIPASNVQREWHMRHKGGAYTTFASHLLPSVNAQQEAPSPSSSPVVARAEYRKIQRWGTTPAIRRARTSRSTVVGLGRDPPGKARSPISEMVGTFHARHRRPQTLGAPLRRCG